MSDKEKKEEKKKVPGSEGGMSVERLTVNRCHGCCSEREDPNADNYFKTNI